MTNTNASDLIQDLVAALDALQKEAVTTSRNQIVTIGGVSHAIPISNDLMARDAIYGHLLDRARAYLAQLSPEWPTDQEITEWADAAIEVPLEELDPEVHGWRRCFKQDEFADTIRAALDRWGK